MQRIVLLAVVLATQITKIVIADTVEVTKIPFLEKTETAHYTPLYYLGKKIFESVSLSEALPEFSCSHCHSGNDPGVTALKPRRLITLEGREFFGWYGDISYHGEALKVPHNLFLPQGINSPLQVMSILALVTHERASIWAEKTKPKDQVIKFFQARNRLINNPSLQKKYNEAFPGQKPEHISLAQFAWAIEYYIRASGVILPSQFDRRIQFGVASPRLLEVIKNRGCISCHTPPSYFDNKLWRVSLETGREVKIKTPTLRNLGEMKNFGHNRRYKNLDDLLRNHPKDIQGYERKNSLSEFEKQSIKKWLEKLTSVFAVK